MAVLLSGVKMALVEALEKDRLLDEPYVRRFYFDYFPAELRRAYDFGGLRHPLERQIKGTVVTNLVVDQAGIAFVLEASALSGRGWPEVVRAYLMADAVAEAGTLRDRIYALDNKMPADEQYRVLMRLEAFLADFAGSILLQGGAALDFEEIPSLREGLAECRGVLKRAVQGEAQAAAKAEQRRLTRLGLRPALAEQIAWLPHMKGFLAVSRLAATTGISVSEVVALEKALETQLGFDALEQALASAPTAGGWDMQFCEGLSRTINRRRHEILEKVLKKGRAGGKAQARVGAYLERNSGAWAEYQANLGRVLAQGEPELVALGVVVSALEHL
jgi:glutamate dehydrogenase